jgi:hypothetical protein
MNQALEQLASSIGLSADGSERLRLAFGYACAARVEHLLEQPEVADCLRVLGEYVGGGVCKEALQSAKGEAERLANRHRGSNNIDGCGHAAVSASYAVANALNGRALQAASYAAYAMVYSGGGYAAVAERVAFEAEFAWQLGVLADLAAAVRPAA